MLAFAGLAFDLNSPKPFTPDFDHKPAMLKSEGFKWMKENAHTYGITPYKKEPWHWECVITRQVLWLYVYARCCALHVRVRAYLFSHALSVSPQSWATACEFTPDLNVRVQENVNGRGLTSALSAWN